MFSSLPFPPINVVQPLVDSIDLDKPRCSNLTSVSDNQPVSLLITTPQIIIQELMVRMELTEPMEPTEPMELTEPALMAILVEAVVMAGV